MVLEMIQPLLAFNVDDYPEDKIIYSAEPLRLFRSGFLEFFTHVMPVTIWVIYLPVAALALYVGVTTWPTTLSPIWIPLSFALGIALLWTFIEYVVHRFLFHHNPRNRTEATLIFLFHGVHHVQPSLKTRLVMPPAASIPGAILAALLFSAIGSLLNFPMLPLVSGFVLGYILYDTCHYATHHAPMKGRIMKFLKRHHMEHHFVSPNARFGVTTSLWDQVFHTEPAK
jgi:sterol desaturase/sphingolipid hydroxylase (fatty acid hydroxylase superfamily)